MGGEDDYEVKMIMSKCRYCGKEVDKGANVCAGCVKPKKKERFMIKCPDCSGPLMKQKQYYGSSGAVQELETPFWHCPKCKENFDEEVVEDET